MGVDRGFLIVAVCFATMLNVSMLAFYVRLVLLFVSFIGYFALRLILPRPLDCLRYLDQGGKELCAFACVSNATELPEFEYSDECGVLVNSNFKVFAYLQVS